MDEGSCAYQRVKGAFKNQHGHRFSLEIEYTGLYIKKTGKELNMGARGMRHLMLGVALCVGVVGCSHNSKHGHGKHSGYGANTQGAGEGSGFSGSDEARDMLAKRKIYFDYDRSELRHHDYEVIEAHADYLKQNSNR